MNQALSSDHPLLGSLYKSASYVVVDQWAVGPDCTCLVVRGYLFVSSSICMLTHAGT